MAGKAPCEPRSADSHGICSFGLCVLSRVCSLIVCSHMYNKLYSTRILCALRVRPHLCAFIHLVCPLIVVLFRVSCRETLARYPEDFRSH